MKLFYVSATREKFGLTGSEIVDTGKEGSNFGRRIRAQKKYAQLPRYLTEQSNSRTRCARTPAHRSQGSGRKPGEGFLQGSRRTRLPSLAARILTLFTPYVKATTCENPDRTTNLFSAPQM